MASIVAEFFYRLSSTEMCRNHNVLSTAFQDWCQCERRVVARMVQRTGVGQKRQSRIIITGHI